ncbi:large ribosomal subunit protein uL24c-like [Phragmites australis]|uniref:large ribosomal subunit protein uL24c-like n=1 Tax=Phragmites australis TaxID=29695 RepID=UPI002D76FAF0|nr:large ribosomal subunit protein uL24c-like [Phragmites australis]
MAGMPALQGAMASLSISAPSAASTSSFWGNPLATFSALQPGIKFMIKTCPIVMRLKRWERKKCKPNSLPVLHKMHVRIGDTVQVIAGREKGKVGEITRLFKHNSTVIVKDLNLKSKHKKGTDDEPGEIVMIEGPIHSSNVMLYSKEKNVTSRVGHKFLEDGTKARYLIKTGEIIDSVENWVKVFKEGISE